MRNRFGASRKNKVPGMRFEALAMERDENGLLYAAKRIPMKTGEHDSSLTYYIQDPNGKVTAYPNTESSKLEDGTPITIPAVHPSGSRRLRRARQRHHPFYTKSPHTGREWYKILEARNG